MKKTANITKYNLKWQVIRVKNKKIKNVNEKIKNVINFYNENKCVQNWERVYNYLEGLELGYKKFQIAEKNLIREELKKLSNNKSVCNVDKDICFEDVELNILIDLYKDLYNRNKKWLNNNYKNAELNNFLQHMYVYLTNKNIHVDKNFDQMITGENNHHFIF